MSLLSIILLTTLSPPYFTTDSTTPSSWNVLIANPFSGGSHQTVSLYLANLLAGKGHHVTYLSTNIPRTLHPKVKKLDLPLATKKANAAMDNSAENNVFGKTKSWEEILELLSGLANFCQDFFEEPNVQMVLNSGEKYDLLITFGMFDGCGLALGHHLGINNSVIHSPGPFITPLQRTHLGIPLYASTYRLAGIKIADSRYLRESVLVRALQLIENIVFSVLQGLVWRYSIDSVAYKHVHTSYPGYQDLYSSTKMIFMNYHPHPMIDQTATMGPGVINLGGSICSPLPSWDDETMLDLRDFVDSSSAPHYDGFILISFGSHVKRLREEEIALWVEVFSRFPNYRVVWRLAPSHFTTTLPDNIKAYEWLPQQALLYHPNIRLFITHGGQASKMEALCAGGVPQLLVPRFAEQFYSSQYYVDAGMAEQVIMTLGETSVEEITTKINRVMLVYAGKMKEVAKEVLETRVTDEQVLGYLRMAISGHRLLPGYQSWWQLFYLDIILLPVASIIIVKFFIGKLRKYS